MQINYQVVKEFTQTLDVQDLGETAIRGANSAGESYFILTRTSLGKFMMLTFGPTIEDMPEELLPGFSLSYSAMDYSEKKILKLVSAYVNDPMKEISQLEEVSREECVLAAPRDVFKTFESM